MLRIEAGKYYETADGVRVGPMVKMTKRTPWPWTAEGAKYRYSDTGEPFYPALGDEGRLRDVD